ncbi:MAG: nucleoside hydrolase-like domain-containing protein [Bacteroidales bacterium]
MKRILIFLALIVWCFPAHPANTDRHRIIVLTDIENEPDDAQSLIRFMLYSNQWDTEAIIATTSCWMRDRTAAWRIYEILDAYEKVQPNLLKHEAGYPTAEFLRARVKEGIPKFGMEGVGPGQDSDGSEWIISVIDKDDDRPIWVQAWGGVNTLAQALWKLKHTRPEREVESIVSRLRVYTISDQDNSGPWIRRTFPGLFYIVSPGFHENNETAYHYATWTGIAGERWYRYPSGADTSIIRNNWVRNNIRNKGPLGAQYPLIDYIMEGDTPSFLYLIDNGLNFPERPDYGGWGGRYELYTPPYKKWFHEPETRPIWTNTEDMVVVDGTRYISPQATIWRWREAFQNDFLSRINWTIMNYEEANHPPVPILAHPNEITVKSNDVVKLDATPTTDPDGDNLTYNWYLYFEPGSYLLFTDYQSNRNHQLDIENSDKSVATFTAPAVNKPSDMHIILEVTDDGDPALTRYQRVIVNIMPEK